MNIGKMVERSIERANKTLGEIVFDQAEVSSALNHSRYLTEYKVHLIAQRYWHAEFTLEVDEIDTETSVQGTLDYHILDMSEDILQKIKDKKPIRRIEDIPEDAVVEEAYDPNEEDYEYI
jgi:hypothetical protein